mmetsp:Transcript_9452/g.10768  ORF Transcript_9452/g.10768 Transcript_9452/m.10768 type:complete len:279 (+) Transcript_9452:1-837(+)
MEMNFEHTHHGHSICITNMLAANAVGRTDLELVWKLLELVTNTRIANAEAAPLVQGERAKDGSNSNTSVHLFQGNYTGDNWSHSPCGRKLIKTLFDTYAKVRDVQTMATVSCVLEDQRVTTEWSETLPLLDPKWITQQNNYRRAYADILQRWGLYITRTEVLKYTKTELQQSDDQLLCVQRDISKSTSSIDSNSNMITKIGGEITKTDSLSLSTDDSCLEFEPISNSRLKCALCDVAVKGLVTFCRECGHGGHADHMNEWFQLNQTCPTGCGCKCDTS